VFVWRMILNRDATVLVPITTFNAHQTFITRVLLSPDVRHLATCSADHTARIWTVESGGASDDDSPSNSLVGSDSQANGAGPVPTGDPAPFALETTLDSHQRWVWDCAWSADSAYLVTACSDHFARLWELSSQSIIRQYHGHHRGAVCVALNDTASPCKSIVPYIRKEYHSSY
jgi:target of rapamycin complex subunit LST8